MALLLGDSWAAFAGNTLLEHCVLKLNLGFGVFHLGFKIFRIPCLGFKSWALGVGFEVPDAASKSNPWGFHTCQIRKPIQQRCVTSLSKVASRHRHGFIWVLNCCFVGGREGAGTGKVLGVGGYIASSDPLKVEYVFCLSNVESTNMIEHVNSSFLTF